MKYIIPIENFFNMSFLNEAIRTEDFEKANTHIISYLEKNLGKIYKFPEVDEYTHFGDVNTYAGQRYVLSDGSSFRINWIHDDNSFTPVSIDTYRIEDMDPQFTFYFGKGGGFDEISLAEILPAAVKFIKKPSLNFRLEREMENVSPDTGISEKKLLEYRTKGAVGRKERADKGQKRGSYKDAWVKEGVPDNPLNPTKIPNLTDLKNTSEKVKALFEELKAYIQMVIKGTQNSLVVTGSPGVGKTQTLLDVFKQKNLKEETDYKLFGGKVTASEVFAKFFEFNGQLLIFDDCDSVFDDPNGINLLKKALDSYDERTITWATKLKAYTSTGVAVPQTFTYTGRAIFITNVKLEEIDEAIKSRSMVVDITLTIDEMIEYLRANLMNVGKSKSWGQTVTDGMRQEAFDILVEAAKKHADVKLNFRTLENACKIRTLAEEGLSIAVIKNMISRQAMLTSKHKK